VDETRNPAAFQSARETSVGERGVAEVMAATTASPASTQRIRTGRILDAAPFVNGISASQISPGHDIIVKPFVFGNVAVQESAVIAQRLRAAPLVNPRSQFRKIFWLQLFDGLFDFLNLAHKQILAFANGTFQVLFKHVQTSALPMKPAPPVTSARASEKSFGFMSMRPFLPTRIP
jgi:hypothetical protein